MSRQEFLRIFGLALLSLVGAKAMIDYMLKGAKKPAQLQQSDKGFGSRSFGN